MSLEVNFVTQKIEGCISTGDIVEYYDWEYPDGNGNYSVLFIEVDDNTDDLHITIAGIGKLEGTITSYTLLREPV